jgi:hypothetical protein
MFLALKSPSSHAHSPRCQPVSQQKVTISKPLQLWLINILLGLQSSSSCTRYQTAVKMYPQVHCQMNKKISDFHTTNAIELSTTQDATSCATTQQISSILWNRGGGGGALLHSQELATCPYHVSDQSRPYPLINIIYPPTSWSF